MQVFFASSNDFFRIFVFRCPASRASAARRVGEEILSKKLSCFEERFLLSFLVDVKKNVDGAKRRRFSSRIFTYFTPFEIRMQSFNEFSRFGSRRDDFWSSGRFLFDSCREEQADENPSVFSSFLNA